MDLGLAGALSGAGAAGTQALATAQVQYGASKLQDERDKMENLRLEKTQAFQERMQGKTQAHAEGMQGKQFAHAETLQQQNFQHTEAQTDKSIGAQERNVDKTLTHAETMQKEGFKHTEGQTDKTIASHERIGTAGNISHEKIAGMNNKIQLRIAEIQTTMHEKQYDKTFTAARLGALKDTVRELGNEITRLSVAASNPLADKTDPSYKALLIQLDHATKMHNLYSQQVGLEAGVSLDAIAGATTKKEPAPWKSPTSAAQAPAPAPAPAPARRSGGMVQTQRDAEEESRMEAALELYKRGAK